MCAPAVLALKTTATSMQAVALEAGQTLEVTLAP